MRSLLLPSLRGVSRLLLAAGFVALGLLHARAETVPITPGTPRAHAAGISLRSLDLSRGVAPSEAELRAAGQLGSPLSPSRSADPAVSADPARQAADNLLFARAMQEWNAHHFRAARGLFLQHRGEHPDSPWAGEAELHVGCEAQFGGDWPQAKRSFERILAGERKGSDIYQKAKLRRAVLHMDQGEMEESTRAFAEMLTSETSWERRTYAQTWIRQLSLYKANEVALRDCGSNSIAFVLRARGQTAAADRAAGAPASAARGFSVGELAEFARARGLEPVHAVHAEAGQLARLTTPFVAHYTDRHFVVVTSVGEAEGDGGKEVKVYDPRLRREVALAAAQFTAQWSGLALVFGEAPPAEVRLAAGAELRDNFGGCCGLPRPEEGLGPPDCDNGGCSKCRGMPEWSVNPVNMNLVVQDIPLWYDNPVGPKVEIHLTYNSQDSLNQLRPFGNKWSFNYASYAMESPSSNLPDGTVTLIMPGGRRDNYLPAAGGGYTPPVGIFNTLVKTAAYTFLLTDPEGTIYSYGVPAAMAGQSTSTLLLSITDRHGAGLTFTHDAAGRLMTIKDVFNRATTLHYNAAGLVDDIADPFGRHATFGYDAGNNLIEQTDMGGIGYGYTYAANVYLATLRKPTGITQFYIEPADGINNGAVRYPAPGAVMWENYRLTVTDPAGFKEEFYYNGYSRVACHRDRGQLTQTGVPPDPVNVSNKTTWNLSVSNGKGVVTTTAYGDGTQDNVSNFGTQNLPGHVYDGFGGYVDYTYNAQGRVLTRQSPRTNPVTSQNYKTTYQYAPNGFDLVKVTDPLGKFSARYTYSADSHRHRLTSTDALDHTTAYTYNNYGQALTVTNPLNEWPTVYAYNALQQLTAVTRNGQTLASFTYDAVGRVQMRTDADGHSLISEYDGLNRPTRTLYPDGTDERKQWGCCHLDSETDRLGKTTLYTYDSLNRLKTKTDPLNQTVTYDYTPNDDLAKLTDAKSQATRWEYDVRRRANKKLYADNTFETYAHDGAGHLTGSVDPKGIQTAYLYDGDGNLKSRTVTNVPTGTAPVPTVTFTYDGANRRVAMQDGRGTTAYTYDDAGSRVGEDGPLADDTVTFTYDALNRLYARAVNSVGSLALNYDEFGRVYSVANSLGTFTNTFAGPASPRVTSVTSSRLLVTDYSYYGPSGDFRLQGITHRLTASKGGPTPGTISSFAYTYNPRGEITRWDRSRFIPPSATPQSTEPWVLGYDAAGQLLSADNPAGTPTPDYGYSYDAAGNVQNFGSESSTFNALNQLTYRYRWIGGSENPVYDGNGNITTNGVTYPPGYNYTYEWDALNRLTAVVKGNQRSEFTYDGLGCRVQAVEKTMNGGSATITSQKKFLWVGSELVREQEMLSGVTKYFYAQGVKVSGGAAPGNFFYTRDHLGSVREMIDSAGAVRARYDYDPYGARTKVSGDLESDFGFTGHYLHQPSGLHLALYRAYDAGAGRWLSRDPLTLAETARDGANLYGYVRNAPTVFVDPLGRQAAPPPVAPPPAPPPPVLPPPVLPPVVPPGLPPWIGRLGPIGAILWMCFTIPGDSGPRPPLKGPCSFTSATPMPGTNLLHCRYTCADGRTISREAPAAEGCPRFIPDP